MDQTYCESKKVYINGNMNRCHWGGGGGGGYRDTLTFASFDNDFAASRNRYIKKNSLLTFNLDTSSFSCSFNSKCSAMCTRYMASTIAECAWPLGNEWIMHNYCIYLSLFFCSHSDSRYSIPYTR